ncbi:MucB/RseB C-terminal domain-containing protein [Methylomonas fluvii]|uniref:MucB/RseB C-terminal domain-containing protein n=1 Tax=Methylomonas fluvii TaxID=1854564 RepID=A0ABR9DJQ9_9GAMM|nr:MucB/RseB C-terminal domain-containing protein [Methylomonas fluvii]MBD9363260.1 MucB/RseB C-terminal domain-containing protein [Methylomonas fluvii]
MRVLKAFLLCVVCQSAFADKDHITARQWLDNMNRAMKTLNYRGTVIFMKNGQLDTMKYQHSVENGVEQERLASLNSPMREVTRKSNEVTCTFKETSQKVVNHHPLDSSFIVNLPQNTANLEKNYQLVLSGQESIAMLPTQIVSVEPTDALRYPRKIWVDTQHFLPLKVEVYNLDGSILEQVVFTDLMTDTLAEPHAGNVDDNSFHVKHIHTAQAEPFENATFVLKNWPAGFESVFFIRNSIQQSQKAVDHLLISDGFSTVSVYLEAKESQGMNGLHSLGSVNSFSKVIGDTQFTVLGEVPAKTVELIADGIALR